MASRQQHTADGLTGKQRGFVDGIERGLSGVDAARAAGYAGSASTLASIASRLLRHDGVRAALKARGVRPGRGKPTNVPTRPAPPSGASGAKGAAPAKPPRELTPAQTVALAALLRGETQSAAAKEAGVGLRTVTRWYDNPAFRAELDAQRLATLERGRLRVEGMVDDALAVARAVLVAASRCAGCDAEIAAPTKEAQAMALAMLDRAGVGSRALDVPALRERMKGEAAGALAELLKDRLPADVYRQVLEAMRGGT